MDMILTGRPVLGPEAYDMGLANRLVSTGRARHAAEELAREIAAFPQTCVRGDRMSVLEAAGLSEDAALANEVRHGLATIEATRLAGVDRFRDGAGRHGTF
jgi:enoyl-CoA hydratase/carnithine racemase